jgi:hypothetical protein
VCECRDSGAIDFKVDVLVSGICEDVADLRFELGVKSSAAEAELDLAVCVAHAQLLTLHRSGRFPFGPSEGRGIM